MHFRYLTPALVLAFGLASAHCTKNSSVPEQDKKPTSSNTATNVMKADEEEMEKIVEDTALSQEVMQAPVEHVIATVQMDEPKEFESEGTCAAKEDGQVDISLNSLVNKTIELSNIASVKLNKQTIDIKLNRNIAEGWKKEGVKLTCDKDNKYVSLSLKDLKGVIKSKKLKIDDERTLNLDVEAFGDFKKFFANLNGRTIKTTVEGEEIMEWVDVKAEGSAPEIEMESRRTYEITHTRDAFSVDGQKSIFVKKISVDPNNKLKVKVYRNKETKEWTTKTIDAGALITKIAGGQVVTNFKTLTFKRGQGCNATAGGGFSGHIINPKGEIVRYFNVDFTGDGKATAFWHDSEKRKIRNYSFVMPSCAFDEFKY